MIEKIALFDMDGTLVDYHNQLEKDMNLLYSPTEEKFQLNWNRDTPEYINKRKLLITRQIGWWKNLPKLKLGFDVLKWCTNLGFNIMICTKGPTHTENAWTEKLQWVKENLKNVDNITITTDKGLIYGRVLVDDYPDYALRWLEHRKRGLVVMPDSVACKNFKHKSVVIYDGKNKDEVQERLRIAYER